MKRVVSFIPVFVAVAACKKKSADTTPLNSQPAPVVHKITVKINGTEAFCDNSCFSSSSSGGLVGSYFYLAGFNESIYIGNSLTLAPGAYNLSKYGNPNLVYFKNNAQYHAVSGKLNITSIDTLQGGTIKKINATLDFKTDTSGSGLFFCITEGKITIN